jgi:hypothetical protein
MKHFLFICHKPKTLMFMVGINCDQSQITLKFHDCSKLTIKLIILNLDQQKSVLLTKMRILVC